MDEVSHSPDDDAPDVSDDQWRRLAPAAATVKTIAGAIGGTVLSVPASAALTGLLVGTFALHPLVGGPLAFTTCTIGGAGLGAWLGRLRWARTWWRLDSVGLHVRRGVWWRLEALVPRSRVQHLDVERGPLERQFQLATLVVHTAGTQTAALRLSGLEDQDAVALRDALIPALAVDGDAL